MLHITAKSKVSIALIDMTTLMSKSCNNKVRLHSSHFRSHCALEALIIELLCYTKKKTRKMRLHDY